MQCSDNDEEYDDLSNFVNMIEVQPCKGQTTLFLDISSTHIDASMHTYNGPLYIINQINEKPTREMLIDLLYLENVITGEFLFVHELYKDNYE